MFFSIIRLLEFGPPKIITICQPNYRWSQLWVIISISTSYRCLEVLVVRRAPVMGVIPSAGSAVSAVPVSPNNAIRASTAALVLQLVL